MNDNETARICYCEKGVKVAGQPSLIFIHGFASSKRTWLSVIKHIPHTYHCIAIDLPGHGESIGFNEEYYIGANVIDLLKQFFDKLHFIEPICLIGESMGGSIVAMFATKYPFDVGIICLLSPPPGEEYETDLLQQLRSGTYHSILPETLKQYHAAVKSLSEKKIRLTRLLTKKYFKTHLHTVNQYQRILQVAFEHDYPNLGETYKQLKYLTCPAFIIWGREDKLCHPAGAHYLAKLLSKSELIIFDNCGHLITIDKPEETADAIINFLERNPYYESRSEKMMRLIIKLTLAVLILLNSILQIDGFIAVSLSHYGQNYDDIIASERQVENEDFDEVYKVLTELISRLEEDDQQTILNIIQLTATIETGSCIQDEEIRKSFVGDLYDYVVEVYPMYKDKYHQLLEKLDSVDQVNLKKIVDRAKTVALERCQSLTSNE
ncbi:unnamed protein product [Rotaria sordida]|nr:unnamed protein product [Rotaria sordida]